MEPTNTICPFCGGCNVVHIEPMLRTNGNELYCRDCFNTFSYHAYIKGMLRRTKQDMVAVTRCKNCQFHDVGENEVDSWDRCRLHNFNTSDGEYCSWAVPKGDKK